jgi:4-hydroxy-tetrahydrodipicolinate synthase
MVQTLPSGTYVPIVTPFTEQGGVDYLGLHRLIDRLLLANVEAIVVMGTTGESPTVNAQEFSEVVRFAMKRVNGAAAVLSGVGCNDTQASLHQAQAAANQGVDGLLVVCPYYNKPTQQGLYQHFKYIAENVPVPQLVYNIAGRTGVNIETDTLLRLAELQNITGVKESSDNIEQVSEVLQRLPEEFLVLSGCDHLNFTLLCLGGHGVISTVANLVPERVKAMVDAVHNDELRSARQLHFELQRLVSGCFSESNPIPVKTALALMGEIQEVFRPPLCSMNSVNRHHWQSTLAHYNLIGRSEAGSAT